MVKWQKHWKAHFFRRLESLVLLNMDSCQGGRMRNLLAAMLCLLPAAHAWASTVYVDATNTSGIEDGTPEHPFNTIQEGLNAAVAGSTVSVAPGRYYGSIELKHQVKLISQQGPRLTGIVSSGSYAVVQAYAVGADTYIEGFTIDGSSGVLVEDRISFWGANYMQIHNCILKDMGVGIQMSPNSYLTITRSLFYFGSLGINSWFYAVPVLYNVTMDFVSTPLMFYRSWSYVYDSIFSHANCVVSTWGKWGTGSAYGSHNDFVAYNNMACPNSSGWYPYVGFSSSLYVDPMFDSSLPHGVDYHLREGSPLIDAGVYVGLPYNGSAPDIGAFETDYAPSIPELGLELAESFQDVPFEEFKNAGEQRRRALNNKMQDVLAKIDSITETMTAEEKVAIWSQCADKLRHDILAKADGFYGGHPDNDWIVTKEEQDRIYPVVMELIDSIETEIARLTASSP
jgi:hypothetical protein